MATIMLQLHIIIATALIDTTAKSVSTTFCQNNWRKSKLVRRNGVWKNDRMTGLMKSSRRSRKSGLNEQEPRCTMHLNFTRVQGVVETKEERVGT